MVGSGLLLWQHRVARGAQATGRPPAAGLAAVALERDSEAAAVPRLVPRLGDAQERYSVCLAQADKRLPSLAAPKRPALSSNF